MAAPSRKGYIARMADLSPLENRRLRRRRFRRIPVRTLAPNLVTLLALCAGLTAIRLAFENRYGLALAAIVFAAILDGIDGRLARLLNARRIAVKPAHSASNVTRFGASVRTGMRRNRRRRSRRFSNGDRSAMPAI